MAAPKGVFFITSERKERKSMADTQRGSRDGKQNRPKKVVVPSGAGDTSSDDPVIAVGSGFRGNDLFCFYAHELMRSGKGPVTLEKCAGNLYSSQDEKCNNCGVCRCYLDLHQDLSDLDVFCAVSEFMYPERPVKPVYEN